MLPKPSPANYQVSTNKDVTNWLKESNDQPDQPTSQEPGGPNQDVAQMEGLENQMAAASGLFFTLFQWKNRTLRNYLPLTYYQSYKETGKR